ncbi:MAG: barstar family protein [Holophagaceae bacterium]
MALSFLGPALIQSWRGSAGDLVDSVAGQPALWWLRGSRMRTRQGLMDEWAAAAQFPPHFGGTWDALRDALAELPEGGTFLILEADQLLREAPPEAFEALVAVLRDAQADLAPNPLRVVLQASPEHHGTLVEGLRALGLA